jgi:hypothetical protein
MHWMKRRMRRPSANEPGHAHELTFLFSWLAHAVPGAHLHVVG